MLSVFLVNPLSQVRAFENRRVDTDDETADLAGLPALSASASAASPKPAVSAAAPKPPVLPKPAAQPHPVVASATPKPPVAAPAPASSPAPQHVFSSMPATPPPQSWSAHSGKLIPFCSLSMCVQRPAFFLPTTPKLRSLLPVRTTNLRRCPLHRLLFHSACLLSQILSRPSRWLLQLLHLRLRLSSPSPACLRPRLHWPPGLLLLRR